MFSKDIGSLGGVMRQDDGQVNALPLITVYNADIMNNKLQIICLVILVVLAIIQTLLYFSVTDRLTTLEAKQVVIERHLDTLREDQLNIYH